MVLFTTMIAISMIMLGISTIVVGFILKQQMPVFVSIGAVFLVMGLVGIVQPSILHSICINISPSIVR